MLSSSTGAAPGRRNAHHSQTSSSISNSPPPHASQTVRSPSPLNSTRHGEVVRLDSDESDTTTPTSKRLRADLISPRRKGRGERVQLREYPRKIHIQSPGEESADASRSQASPESEPHVKSAGRFTSTLNSWRDRYREPSASDVNYGTPDEHAVPIRRPVRRPAAEGEMVVPKGPTRPSLFTSTSIDIGAERRFRKGPFDLTSSYNTSGETDGEPRRKKQKTASAMSDSSETDSILYASGRQPLASRSAKLVSSSIPPYDSSRRSLGEVLESLTAEKMVSGSRAVENPVNGRSRQMNTTAQQRSEEQDRDSPVDSSRANPITIDDDDDRDEIQDSGPEIGRPYQGTANRSRPRTAEEKDMANRAWRQSRTHSQHFKGEESTVSFPNASGGSNAMNLLRKTGRKGSFPASQGRIGPEEIEGISDEEIKYEKTSKSKEKQSKTIMSEFVKKDISDSISTGGDIPASYPGSRPRIVNGRTGASKTKTASFPIEYIRSSSEKWEHKEGADQWYFQYNPRNSTFDIMASGEDASKICDSFVVKPSSIQRVLYGENGKIVLYKSADTTKQGSNKLLIRFNKDRSGRFVQSLQNNGLDVNDVKPVDDDKMDRIFKRTEDDFDNIRQPSKRAEGLPEDVMLLRRREALRHAEQQQSERGNAGPARGNLKAERLDGSKVGPRSQRLSDRMRKDDSSTGPSKVSHSDDEEQPKKFKNPATITRSTRSQNREARRSPSPPPFYWTEQNPGWESYWKGSALIFPLDGKKQTPVDRCDIKRLDEGEFLNDNLISFYLRYLEDKAERERPDIAKRVHIMSPFFYQRLTRGKGRKNIDYDGVKRWTSKVNIFAYDYIVVPVNENQHWYVAIICNAPKLIQSPKEQTVEEEQQVEDDEKDIIDLGDSQIEVVLPAKTPRDIMDGQKSPDIENKVSNLSIGNDPDEWPPVEENGGPHNQPSTFSKARTGMVDGQTSGKGLAATEDNDLPQETTPSSAKGKKGRRKSHPPVRKYNAEEPRIITLDSLGHAHSPTCSNLKEFLICEAKEKLGVEVTLAQHSIGMTAKNIPLQNNYCDCGLFLLGYVEGFMENPDETVHDIMQSNDTTRHFVNMNASNMRNSMRDLIFALRRDQRQREIDDIKAKKATKAKKNEPSNSQLQRSEVSSASASPKPVGSSRKELEIPASSASSTAEVEEKPSVCEIQDAKPAEARGETSEEICPLPDADNVLTLMDDLAGYDEQMEPSETDVGEAKPGVYVRLGDAPEYTARNAINESTSPVIKIRASQKAKPSPVKTPRSPRSTRGYLDIKTEARKPRYVSQQPSPKRDDDEGVVIPVKTFRRPPPAEVDAQPSSQDSLLDAMSPGKRRAAKKMRLAQREIPDSQSDGQQLEDGDFEDIMEVVDADGGMQGVVMSARSPGSWRVEAMSPRRLREVVKSPGMAQMRLGGASSMFGGGRSPRGQREGRQRMERRGEESHIVVDGN